MRKRIIVIVVFLILIVLGAFIYSSFSPEQNTAEITSNPANLNLPKSLSLDQEIKKQDEQKLKTLTKSGNISTIEYELSWEPIPQKWDCIFYGNKLKTQEEGIKQVYIDLRAKGIKNPENLDIRFYGPFGHIYDNLDAVNQVISR